MFLYYLIASLILSFLNYIKNERVGEKDKEFRKESDKVAGLTGELVRGARDIKMLNSESDFVFNGKKRENDNPFNNNLFNTNFNIGLNNYNNNNRSLFEDINDYNYIRENNYPYYSNNLDYKDYLF